MTARIVVDGRFSDKPAKVVWKYSIALALDPQQLLIPSGARLLHIEFARSGPFDQFEFLLWYEVDLKNKDTRQSHIYQVWATGEPSIPHHASHIAIGIEWAVNHRNDRLNTRSVWHLYEFASGAKIVEA